MDSREIRRLFLLGSLLVPVYFVVLQGAASGQNRVPPRREPRNCRVASEAGIDTFRQKGGRSTAKVRFRGNELTVPGVSQGRNLTRYDRLDLADPIARTAAGQRDNEVVARARTFLFEHWRDHKPAYLSLTIRSVDATSTSHIFIEPDQAGRWRVAWRIVRDKGRIDDLPTYYSIEWATATGSGGEFGTPVPVEQTSDPVKGRLVFRDSCGDIDQTL